MPSFLSKEEFLQRTSMPRSYAEAIDVAETGWLDRQLSQKTSWIEARLAKRYGPFTSPYPEVLQDWLAALVTFRCWLRRGHDPTDEQALLYKEEAAKAEAEIFEAANSETGLFDLPLRADLPGSTGISRGGTFGYSEQSPYVWMEAQRDTGRSEDGSGGGTFW